jgi:hypothetical protein
MGQMFRSRPAAVEDNSTTGHSVGVLWWHSDTVYSTALQPALTIIFIYRLAPADPQHSYHDPSKRPKITRPKRPKTAIYILLFIVIFMNINQST